jgi:hypothetical protein
MSGCLPERSADVRTEIDLCKTIVVLGGCCNGCADGSQHGVVTEVVRYVMTYAVLGFDQHHTKVPIS